MCRRACPLPYWEIFSDTEYCDSENFLISYDIFRWQISVWLQAFTRPTSSALVFSVAASSVLRIELAVPALWVLPIETKVCRTNRHSSPYTHDSTATCQADIHRTLLAGAHKLSVLPCHYRRSNQFWNRLPTTFNELR